jgi:hypothetical protein
MYFVACVRTARRASACSLFNSQKVSTTCKSCTSRGTAVLSYSTIVLLYNYGTSHGTRSSVLNLVDLGLRTL